MRYATGVLLVVACVLPAWASEPGQPLDCSDMVFTEPGLTCTVVVSVSVRWPYRVQDCGTQNRWIPEGYRQRREP